MDWLRLYTEILDDEKIAKMTDTQYRIFTYLMLVAREKDQNGSFTYDENDIAWRLRRPKAQINNTTQKLIELEIITIENNILTFINWSKRQYKSDDINARVKRYREKNETLQVTLENRTEQIQNRIKEKGKVFSPPSIEEIKSFCKERNNKVNPQQFFDFYTAKNWMIGKNKMKNWQAAVRTWEVRDNGNTTGYKNTTTQARRGFETERERNNAAACEEADRITKEYYEKIAACGDSKTNTG